MRLKRGHTYGLLVLFVAVWATLALAGGTMHKADVDFGSGSEESAIELGLKVCAALFTAVATAVGVLQIVWRRLPVLKVGLERRSPLPRLERRYRPPPHGISLLQRLQIIRV